MRRFLLPGFAGLVALAAGSVALSNDLDRPVFGLDPALIAELAASASPRERALAADAISQVDTFGGDGTAIGDRNVLLAEAAAAAPDDAFVQWLAYAYERPATVESARKLVASDPGNAAVWLVSLGVATAANDAAGIDAAIAGMAQAGRYDDHVLDHFLAWVDIHARATTNDSPLVGQTNALARSGMLGNPRYKALIDACDAPKLAMLTASRGDACEKVGRVMATGPTLIVQGIGYGVLRRSGRATAADAEAERALHWLIRTAMRVDEKDVMETMHRMIADWRETGSESEAMRRRLARAGKSLTPPPDWVAPVPGASR